MSNHGALAAALLLSGALLRPAAAERPVAALLTAPVCGAPFAMFLPVAGFAVLGQAAPDREASRGAARMKLDHAATLDAHRPSQVDDMRMAIEHAPCPVRVG